MITAFMILMRKGIGRRGVLFPKCQALAACQVFTYVLVFWQPCERYVHMVFANDVWSPIAALRALNMPLAVELRALEFELPLPRRTLLLISNGCQELVFHLLLLLSDFFTHA